MLLPTPLNRARIRAFWVVVGLLLPLAPVLVLRWVGVVGSVGALVGWFAVAAAVVIPGLLRPYALQNLYRGWNYGVRKLARLIEAYLVAVCFLTVMLPLGVGSPTHRFERAPTSPSVWRERKTQDAATYTSQHFQKSGWAEGGGWRDAFMQWRDVSGRPATIVLLPFLAMLQVVFVDGDARRPKQGNIYTLY